MKRFTISNQLINRNDIDVCFIEFGYDETEHVHDGLELLFVVSGSASNTINNNSEMVERGSLLLIDYDCVHKIQMLSNIKYYNILFKASFLSEKLDTNAKLKELLKAEFGYNLEEDYLQVKFDPEVSDYIEGLFNNILSEGTKRKNRYEEIMRCNLSIIINQLLRRFDERQETSKDLMLNDAINYIITHCCEKINLEEVANRYNYHPKYFSLIIKKYCGYSFKQLVQRRRLNNVIYNLWETDDTIEQIAIKCGFENLSYFYELFDKVYGVKPKFVREYKKNYVKYLELKANHMDLLN